MSSLVLAQRCTRCSLSTGRVVWGMGPLDALAMLLGEAPGKGEHERGEPFVGKTGGELDRFLGSAGLRRGRLFLTNMGKCWPGLGNRDPNQEEIEACSRWLNMEMDRLTNLRVIGTIGRVSTRHFLGDVDMEQVHGVAYQKGKYVVVPIYHPAAGLRDPIKFMHSANDIQVLAGVIRGSIKPDSLQDEYQNPKYELLRGGREVRNKLGKGAPGLFVDTESCAGGMWCMQATIAPGEGYMVMANDKEGVAALGEVVQDDATVTVLHNLLYDAPLLWGEGVRLKRMADTMVMAYLLQNEPQGLKPLAYRIAGMEMKSYDELVGPYNQRKALDYLRLADRVKWRNPDPLVVWEKGNPRVKQPQNVGRKIKRLLNSEDPYGGWNKLGGKEQVELELGPMPKAYLSDIPFDTALWYSCRDSDATCRVHPYLFSRIKELGLEGTFWRDMRAAEMVVDMMLSGIKVNKAHFKGLATYMQGRVDEIERELARMFGGNINPGSGPQVRELLFKRLKLRSISTTATGEASTGEKVLARIAGEHPVVQLIRDWRSYQKLKTSYVEVLPRKADPKDCRVRANMRITRVATGRLSCSDPNLMAQPVRTAEGRRIREGFVAEDGCSLVSNDYSQIEMRVVASEANDARMMKIFMDDLDIHTQTASLMFGVPEGQVDEMKHRYPAKRVGFGILNNLSPEGLQREIVIGGAKEEDWPISACEDMIVAWFDIYSGIKQYMVDNHTMALRYGYVVDMWGRRRYVPGAKSHNKKLREEALRQAGNAPIQMGAQGVIKQAMGGLVPYYRKFRLEGWMWSPLIQIHDDLVQEISDDLLPVAIPITVSVMEMAAPQMKVPIYVDPKVGKSWGKLSKWLP